MNRLNLGEVEIQHRIAKRTGEGYVAVDRVAIRASEKVLKRVGNDLGEPVRDFGGSFLHSGNLVMYGKGLLVDEDKLDEYLKDLEDR